MQLIEDPYSSMPSVLREPVTRTGFVAFMDAIRREIASPPGINEKLALALFAFALRDAAARGCLRDVDCRAIVQKRIPFLRMFHEAFPCPLPRQLWMTERDDQGLATRWRVEKKWTSEDRLPPFRLLSQFIDLLLFAAECAEPGLNLLVRMRTPFEYRPWISDEATNVLQLPVPSVSLIRWRRHLRIDPAFKAVSTGFARGYEKLGLWVFLAPMEGLPEGVLFESRSGDPAGLSFREAGGFNSVLAEVCREHRIEMLGSLRTRPGGEPRLHFLPARIHCELRKSGVSITMPDFYTLDMIKEKGNRDFEGLRILLAGCPKSPTLRSDVPTPEMKKLGKAIRDAIVEGDAPPANTRDADRRWDESFRVVSAVWSALGLFPSNVFSSKYRYRPKPVPLQEAVARIDELFRSGRIPVQHHIHWDEVVLALTRDNLLPEDWRFRFPR